MPVAGRKPKPAGQAVNRVQATHDWTDVVNVPSAGRKLPPRMPSGMAWPTWTKRWWAAVSTMPHAVLWSETDWEYAFVTATIHADWAAKGSTALAKELRDREKVIGTTVDYRRDLRIRYVDPKPDHDTPAGVSRLDDYRDL